MEDIVVRRAPSLDVLRSRDAKGHPSKGDTHADPDTDASIGHSNAHASSHEEDDTRGSDGWRRSDVSTVSSIDSGPDAHLSGFSPSWPGGPPNGAVKISDPSRPWGLPHPPPPPPPPPLDSLPDTGRRPPPPPSSDRSTSPEGARYTIPHPPPPPPPPDSPPNEYVRRGPAKPEPRRSPMASASRGPRRHMNASRSAGRHRSSQRSESSDAASSTFSRTRPVLDTFSDSDFSGEDPIVYHNARNFPPQLPAAPSQTSHAQSKSSAAYNITSWVSKHEASQSFRRQAQGKALPGNVANDTRSGDEESVVSDASSRGEIETLWQQLKEKRARLNDIKTQMARRRKDLRDLRRKKDDTDNAFMSIIRPILVNQRGLLHISTGLLDRRLGDMQRVRTEYHFLESNYEGLEVMLDEEEEELNRLETRFFSLLAAGRTRTVRPVAPQNDSDSDKGLSDVPIALMGISRDGPAEDLHPLYIKLTSTVGDLENAKEEYSDLFLLKGQYEYDEELRNELRNDPRTVKGMDFETPDDMKEFFEEFPSEEQRMRENVAALEQEVQRLKRLCEEKKVMRKHKSVHIAYALDPTENYEDMDLDSKETILESHHTLAHSRFSELLSQPDYVLAKPEPRTAQDALTVALGLSNGDPEKRERERLAAKEVAIDRLITEAEGEDKVDFVNRWLLQELRLSPLNAMLLHSTFETTRALRIRDTWRWQCDVLHYWWRDSVMMTLASEPALYPMESNLSANTSHVGTPQLSRAASDSGLPWPSFHHRTGSSNTATEAAAGYASTDSALLI